MFPSIVLQGTSVVSGRARAVVVGVGSNTAMGSIRDSILQTEDVNTSVLVQHLMIMFIVLSVCNVTVGGFPGLLHIMIP